MYIELKLLDYLLKEVESAWKNEGCWFGNWSSIEKEEIEKLISIYKGIKKEYKIK